MGISQVYDGLLAGSEQFINNIDEHDSCSTVRLVLRVLDDGSAVVRTEAATVVASSRSELLEAVEKALAGCFTEAEQSIKLEGVALPAVVLEHVGRHPGVARAELVRQLVELYNRPSGGVSVIESSRYLTETESCNSESEIISAVVEAANRLLKVIREEC